MRFRRLSLRREGVLGICRLVVSLFRRCITFCKECKLYSRWLGWSRSKMISDLNGSLWSRQLQCNRLFAAKPSRDLLFIKLWAATLRMPEMEKARKHWILKKLWRFVLKALPSVWILKKLRRFVCKALLSSNYFHTNLLLLFLIQTTIKSHSLMLGTSNFAILVFSICSFHFWHSLSYSPQYKIFLGKLWSRDPSCKGPIQSLRS